LRAYLYGVKTLNPGVRIGSVAVLLCFLASETSAGTWTVIFINRRWEPSGRATSFPNKESNVGRRKRRPVAPSPLNLSGDHGRFDRLRRACWINVVTQHLAFMPKAPWFCGAGTSGCVFTLHEATQTIEVYRLGTKEMLLKHDAGSTWNNGITCEPSYAAQP
jgi:hypothetical protein